MTAGKEARVGRRATLRAAGKTFSITAARPKSYRGACRRFSVPESVVMVPRPCSKLEATLQHHGEHHESIARPVRPTTAASPRRARRTEVRQGCK